MKPIILFLLTLIMVGFSASTEKLKQEAYVLPYDIADNEIKPLRNLVDIKMQKTLENRLRQNPKWKRLMNDKKMAVGLVDIRDPYNVKFARVNGNVMMYAASLPKIAVLLSSVQAIEDGELTETDEVKSDLRLMIAKSDNHASTRMIDRIGFNKIASVLTDPRYDLYDEDYGGGLWVGKRYAAGGPRNPDPMLGLSHSATVSQVCRFYYLLAFGKLVSFERSEEMLEIMSDPELHHKFVNAIEKLAPDAKLYRKSGTWHDWHSDSILVWDQGWRRYILVALIEDPKGETIIRNLLPVVEEVLQSSRI